MPSYEPSTLGPPSLVLGGRRPCSDRNSRRQSEWSDFRGPPCLIVGARSPKPGGSLFSGHRSIPNSRRQSEEQSDWTGPPSLIVDVRSPKPDGSLFSGHRSIPNSRRQSEERSDWTGPPSLVVGARRLIEDRPPPYNEPLQGPSSLNGDERQSFPEDVDEDPPSYAEVVADEQSPPSLSVGGRSNGARTLSSHHTVDDHGPPSLYVGGRLYGGFPSPDDTGPSLYRRDIAPEREAHRSSTYYAHR